MDTVFAQAVTKIIEMPTGTQRLIGEALLSGAAQPELPVIEFTDAESAMVDEAIAEADSREVINQEEMETVYNKLRQRGYAEV